MAPRARASPPRRAECALMAPSQSRGIDLLSPLWNFLDLTRVERGDWTPKRRYDP